MPGIINLTSNLRYPFEGPPPSRDGNEAIPQIGENLINVSNTTPSEFRNKNTTEYPVNRTGDSPLLQPITRTGKTLIESEYRNLQPSKKGGSKSCACAAEVSGDVASCPTVYISPFQNAGYN